MCDMFKTWRENAFFQVFLTNYYWLLLIIKVSLKVKMYFPRMCPSCVTYFALLKDSLIWSCLIDFCQVTTLLSMIQWNTSSHKRIFCLGGLVVFIVEFCLFWKTPIGKEAWRISCSIVSNSKCNLSAKFVYRFMDVVFLMSF